MSQFDGPTLRSLRESKGVPLRRVARQASMSHGHLSKVERGEPGRPVTPAVLKAYERATGLRLAGAPLVSGDHDGWRRGVMSEQRRRSINTRMAAVAVGGALGESVTRVVEGTGRVMPPASVSEADVSQVWSAVELVTVMDRRYGGGLAYGMAKALVRWAVLLLEAGQPERLRAPLHAAVAALVQRAGWAAVDADSHDVARSFFTVGLYGAARADDANLRAHVLARVAAQHSYLGYPLECLQMVRLAAADERVSPAALVVLETLRARAYGLAGKAERCRVHVDAAADAHRQAAAEPAAESPAGVSERLGAVVTPARLMAATGHAFTDLAGRTGAVEDREQAVERLVKAVDQLDPDGDARAVGLCLARLARLHLDAGELGAGIGWATRAAETAQIVRSVRLMYALAEVRAAAEAHGDDPGACDLVADLVPLLSAGVDMAAAGRSSDLAGAASQEWAADS